MVTWQSVNKKLDEKNRSREYDLRRMPCVSDSEENEQKDKIEQGASDEFCNGTNPRRSFASSSRFGRPGGRAKVPFHEFNRPQRGEECNSAFDYENETRNLGGFCSTSRLTA